MRRAVVIAAAVLIALLVLSQLLLPPYIEGRVKDRLTKDGGTADVSLSAFPAVTLLFGSGDEAKVHARGLRLDVASTTRKPLDRLDGFDKVDVEVTASTAGPFRVDDVNLERDHGGDPYTTTVHASVSGHDLATYAGGSLGGALGGLLGGLAAGAVPFTSARIPVALDATVASEGGEPHVQSVNGSIAGLPAGPLLEALAEAVARRF
jgi:hypothetical protein